MKIIRCIFLILVCTKGLAQSELRDSNYTETITYRNGLPRMQYDYCIKNGVYGMCGKFFEYDSTGTLLVKGQYELTSDSVECVDCFHVNEIDSTFHKIEKVDCNAIRVGIWYYYYPSGIIKESGAYSEKVHRELYTTIHIMPVVSSSSVSFSGPYASGSSFEYLRHGVWNFYNEKGELTEQIWYHEGRVIETGSVPAKEISDSTNSSSFDCNKIKPGTYHVSDVKCADLVLLENGTCYFTRTSTHKKITGVWEVSYCTLFLSFDAVRKKSPIESVIGKNGKQVKKVKYTMTINFEIVNGTLIPKDNSEYTCGEYILKEE